MFNFQRLRYQPKVSWYPFNCCERNKLKLLQGRLYLKELTPLSGLETLNKQHLASSEPQGDVFFTSPNLDFNKRNILGIDGEVSAHRPHHVTEVQCYTLDHVPCMITNSANSLANSFLFPHHLSTWSPFFFFPGRLSSTLMWLKSLYRVALGLFTITASLQSNIGIFWNSLIAENGSFPQ